jgi:hypothetical protein
MAKTSRAVTGARPDGLAGHARAAGRVLRLGPAALAAGLAVSWHGWAMAAGDPPAAAALSCVDPVSYGADPTGVADSTAAIQKAIDAAAWRPRSSGATAVVCFPPGGFRTTATLKVSSGSVLIEGAAYFATTIYPSGDYGDVFYVTNVPPAPFLFGVSFHNLRIYSRANPTRGAGIHFHQANSSSISNVQVDGEFGAYDVESSYHLFFDSANSAGDNANKGSYGYRFHRASNAAANPSENFVVNSNVRGQSGQTISYALIVNDSDGVQFANSHFGWSSGAAVLIAPEYPNDVIFGIFFSNIVFDNSLYDVYVTSNSGHRGVNGRLSGAPTMSLWNFTGTLFETATLDGFYADAPELANVTAIGNQFVLNGRDGINLRAGAHFKLAQSIFSDNNRSAGSGSHVNLAGTVSDVNLDGSSYLTNKGRHPVTCNIAVSDSADNVTAQNQSFSGASERDLDTRTSGKNIRVSASSTDRP